LPFYCPLCRKQLVFEEGNKGKIDKISGSGKPESSQIGGNAGFGSEKVGAEDVFQLDEEPANVAPPVLAPDVVIANVDPA